MKFRLVPHAIRDLEEIQVFIGAEDPSAAARVVERLVQSFELLSTRPEIGRPIAGRPVREWTVPGLPYLLPYIVREDIVILRVYHTRRKRPKRWL
jgi:plasmid stabilization system protein ParE